MKIHSENLKTFVLQDGRAVDLNKLASCLEALDRFYRWFWRWCWLLAGGLGAIFVDSLINNPSLRWKLVFQIYGGFALFCVVLPTLCFITAWLWVSWIYNPTTMEVAKKLRKAAKQFIKLLGDILDQEPAVILMCITRTLVMQQKEIFQKEQETPSREKQHLDAVSQFTSMFVVGSRFANKLPEELHLIRRRAKEELVAEGNWHGE